MNPIEACAEGPDEPEDDPKYYAKLAAREEFIRAAVNAMASNCLDALV